jgi:hypothetical protein
MEDAPYGGYIRDAVTDSEVQGVEMRRLRIVMGSTPTPSPQVVFFVPLNWDICLDVKRNKLKDTLSVVKSFSDNRK